MAKNKANRQSMNLAVVAVVGVMSGFIGGYFGNSQYQSGGAGQDVVTARYISSDSELISNLAKNVSPSVVSINTTGSRDSFYGSYEVGGAGTGIIISEDGIILTNRHVVDGDSSEIEVTLADGTVYTDVTLLGKDPRGGMDIAYLKLNNVKGLQPAVLGDSDKVVVGDKVIAIGNALGEYQNSVTTGIISGRSRPVETFDQSGYEAFANLLQTDAAINPGNSGGPLFNINGEVIGINTAVAEGENIGFAIPISDVSGSIQTVLSSGEFSVPYIGVRYETLTKATAEIYGLSVKNGAYITSGNGADAILQGSPAEKAGIEAGDIIVKVDGTILDDKVGLSSLVGRKRVGDIIMLDILRGNDELVLKVTLEAAPDSF